MDGGVWHRLGVYFGVRQDSDLLARWDRDRPDIRTRILGFGLVLIVTVVAFSSIVFLVRAQTGGDTGLDSLLWGGLRLIWAAAVVAVLADSVVGRFRSRNVRRAR